MVRRIRFITVLFVVAFGLVGSFIFAAQNASAQIIEEIPGFSFSIDWGNQASQNGGLLEYQVTSEVTRTVYTGINFLPNGMSSVTQTIGTEAITDSFEYTSVDYIVFRPDYEVAPFFMSYRESYCPGISLDLELTGRTVHVTFGNPPVPVKVVTQSWNYLPFESLMHPNSGAVFSMEVQGSFTIYNDTQGTEVCTVLWWDFTRIDDIPTIVHNDVFTMTAGKMKTFYPLSNDVGIEYDFSGSVNTEGLPFQTEVGPWGAWTVISPETGVYTTTYWVHPTNGPSKEGQIVLNVLPNPQKPPVEEMTLVDDVFTMLEGTTATFYPLSNDEGVGQVAGGTVSSEGLPFGTEVGSWGSWTVISPTAGVYTTTYTVSPQNDPAKSAYIFLHVEPKPPVVILVSDVFTATEGDDLSLFPAYNDIGYLMKDIESFTVSHATPLNVTTVIPGEIQIMGVVAGKHLLNYEMVVYGRNYSGYVTLIVSPKVSEPEKPEDPTAEEPTQQPTEKFRLLLSAIRNQ